MLKRYIGHIIFMLRSNLLFLNMIIRSDAHIFLWLMYSGGFFSEHRHRSVHGNVATASYLILVIKRVRFTITLSRLCLAF